MEKIVQKYGLTPFMFNYWGDADRDEDLSAKQSFTRWGYGQNWAIEGPPHRPRNCNTQSSPVWSGTLHLALGRLKWPVNLLVEL